MDELTDGERAADRALTEAVYAPEELKNWPGRHLEWLNPEWCVRVHVGDLLVSYVGIVLRQGTIDRAPALIGGLGRIKTHPAHRRRGLAAWGIRRAVELLHARKAAFGLLVCEPHLIDFYMRGGWREFTGTLFVLQRGSLSEFTFNRVMTLGVKAAAPAHGVIDLQGPPW